MEMQSLSNKRNKISTMVGPHLSVCICVWMHVVCVYVCGCMWCVCMCGCVCVSMYVSRIFLEKSEGRGN